MNILNWILKILNLFKNSAELIKWIAITILVISTFAGFKSCKKERQSKTNAIDILTSKVKKLKTKSELNAIETKNLIIKYKALDNFNTEILQNNNTYLNELAEAKKTIRDLDIRLKDTKNYIKNELIVKDSIRTELIFLETDKIEIKPISKKHIKLQFVQKGNKLDITYIYNTKVSIVISRYPELKLNGKKHFPNWGFLYGWNYKTSSTVDDPNAFIENVISIEFDK